VKLKTIIFHTATSMGRGVYFARQFSYSAHDQYSVPSSDGQKSIYQSLVLTGDFVVGHRSDIEPPLRPSSIVGSVSRYDSVVNDALNPGIFVIFTDTQAYPEYLITFKWSFTTNDISAAFCLSFLKVLCLWRNQFVLICMSLLGFSFYLHLFTIRF